ncbi:multidrug DMT transporter permease [Halobacteriales archaeon QS_1_68_20]|nr:MAG: multidrug DMT transporter permease [Halobacteriales archaeon QS_1_68_20]
MGKWLQSGVRRDVCVTLYGAGELRLKELETRVEDHYGERFEPERFRRKVEKLVKAGHLERRTEGIHDVYALTDAGREALEAHVEWVREETGL